MKENWKKKKVKDKGSDNRKLMWEGSSHIHLAWLCHSTRKKKT